MKGRIAAIFLVMIFLVTACNDDMVYSRYEDVDLAGWDSHDTMSFETRPLTGNGLYNLSLGLKTGNNFPYKNVTIIVQQTVFPSHRTFTDTLECRLYDDEGRMLGNGIGSHQYLFDIASRNFHNGDSLHITIHHNMKRELLPGIGSVGIEIRKTTQHASHR